MELSGQIILKIGPICRVAFGILEDKEEYHLYRGVSLTLKKQRLFT